MRPCRRLLRAHYGSAVPTPSPTPSPTPTPTPTPSATITSRSEFLNWASGVSAGGVDYVLPGLDIGAVDLSGAPKTLGSNQAKLLPVSAAAAKWKFTTTGGASALNLSGWTGIWLEGFQAVHDQLGAWSNPYGIVKINDTAYMTIKNAVIGGASAAGSMAGTSTLGYLMGIVAQRSNNLTINGTKLDITTWGFYGSGDSHNITENKVNQCIEHGFHHEKTTTNLTFNYNLWENALSGSSDHGDLWIGYCDEVSVYNNLTFIGNVVNQQGGYRPQGIYMGGGGPGNNMQNVVMKNNVMMGTLTQALVMISGGTNLMEGNELYLEQGTSDIADVLYVFAGATVATYKNNIGTMYDNPNYGANVLTNANTGLQGPTGTLDHTAMNAKVTALRLAHPQVPT